MFVQKSKRERDSDCRIPRGTSSVSFLEASKSVRLKSVGFEFVLECGLMFDVEDWH